MWISADWRRLKSTSSALLPCKAWDIVQLQVLLIAELYYFWKKMNVFAFSICVFQETPFFEQWRWDHAEGFLKGFHFILQLWCFRCWGMCWIPKLTQSLPRTFLLWRRMAVEHVNSFFCEDRCYCLRPEATQARYILWISNHNKV